MNSPCAPSSWRGLLLGAQAFLPAAFRREPAERNKQVRMPALPRKRLLWLIVTTFLLTTSPRLFAQANDGATVTLSLRFDSHSIFGSAVSPKAGLNLRVTDC